jgi:hypothetical protein
MMWTRSCRRPLGTLLVLAVAAGCDAIAADRTASATTGITSDSLAATSGLVAQGVPLFNGPCADGLSRDTLNTLKKLGYTTCARLSWDPLAGASAYQIYVDFNHPGWGEVLAGFSTTNSAYVPLDVYGSQKTSLVTCLFSLIVAGCVPDAAGGLDCSPDSGRIDLRVAAHNCSN